MVITLVMLISLVISYIDLRSHRVPNRHNLALFSVLLFDMHRIPWRSSFALLSAVLLISILCRVGGGDIKLFSVLIVTQGSYLASCDYLRGLLIATVLMVAMTVAYRRSLQGSIALAPVILAPFLWLYLEI